MVSDLFGVSGRAMIEALIAGERSPWALARLARGTLRNKTRMLEEALTGHFGDHHGFLRKHSGPYLDWRQWAMGRARLTAGRSSGCRPGVSC